MQHNNNNNNNNNEVKQFNQNSLKRSQARVFWQSKNIQQNFEKKIAALAETFFLTQTFQHLRTNIHTHTITFMLLFFIKFAKLKFNKYFHLFHCYFNTYFFFNTFLQLFIWLLLLLLLYFNLILQIKYLLNLDKKKFWLAGFWIC